MPEEPERRRSTDAVLGHVDKLAESVDGLKDRLDQEKRWRKYTLFMFACILAIGAVNVYNTTQTRRANDKIADCTTEGGDCYERGQAQTTSAVKAIVCGQDANMRLLVQAAFPTFVLPEAPKECAASS